MAVLDVAPDHMTCSCCPTEAALGGDDLTVVYRDRTLAEIRDISAVRMTDGVWSDPISVDDDNWKISRSPVSGPSIAARDNRVLVAWFTGAGDVPVAKTAFSPDAGRSFGDAVRIDRGRPVGRADTLMLEDGSGLVLRVERTGDDKTLMLCHLGVDGCLSAREVEVNSANGSVNFTQMAATPGGFYIAWTCPLPDGGRHDTHVENAAMNAGRMSRDAPGCRQRAVPIRRTGSLRTGRPGDRN